eukprot:m.837732 g.837732  ORF g.837732 m.837732 type:complete len:99 (+) comp59490_c1_seq3:1632-1928(+)
MHLNRLHNMGPTSSFLRHARFVPISVFSLFLPSFLRDLFVLGSLFSALTLVWKQPGGYYPPQPGYPAPYAAAPYMQPPAAGAPPPPTANPPPPPPPAY